MMSGSEADQDRIEEDLARTRARMDGRLSALQERLSPGQILDDLMAYFRGSEGGDFARNLMSSVQNNPMPAALVGIGVAWLMASNPHPKVASPSPAAMPMGRVSSPAAWANNNEFDRHIRSVEQGVVRESDEEDPHSSAASMRHGPRPWGSSGMPRTPPRRSVSAFRMLLRPPGRARPMPRKLLPTGPVIRRGS
jgi:hypothetical protein